MLQRKAVSYRMLLAALCMVFVHTVELKMFIVRIFLWFAQSTKVKKDTLYNG